MDDSERKRRDRTIHRAVLSGDADAWQTWYDESFDSLYAYVYWRNGGVRESTDDVVQETWCIAVRQIARYDPERGSFLDWLRGIATNVSRNHARRNDRRRRCERPLAGEPPTDRMAADMGAHAVVADALARLPPHYEAVLRAKYFDRQSVAHIAQARSQTEKSVESLLSRARQAFREIYQRLQNSDE